VLPVPTYRRWRYAEEESLVRGMRRAAAPTATVAPAGTGTYKSKGTVRDRPAAQEPTVAWRLLTVVQQRASVRTRETDPVRRVTTTLLIAAALVELGWFVFLGFLLHRLLS